MKLPKNIKWKPEKNDAVTAVFRFVVRHGEKVAAGLVILLAVWIAIQTKNYQKLPWKPEELSKLAEETEHTILSNTPDLASEKVTPFDYAAFAEQIQTPIPTEPYRSDVEWRPALLPSPAPRGGLEILTAESVQGEAVRKAGVSAQGKPADQWQRPPIPGTSAASHSGPIWVNLYGAIPLWSQWDIYNEVFGNLNPENNRPKYVYYELEKAEVKPAVVNSLGDLDWQPVIVYPGHPESTLLEQFDVPPDFSPDRLVPFAQRTSQEEYASRTLLFSDFVVHPARTYVYRMRLYLVNPNYQLQESSVREGVDTKNKFLRSDWSNVVRVYVPDRTVVQIQSVRHADQTDFPRQAAPLRPTRGTVFLDYFDIELGQSLPLVEKTDIQRGMLCNMSKNEALRFINRGRTADGFVNINFPDTGLRSDVCMMDLSGGRRLQKIASRESQSSPDLSTPSKALLLMPDGTMQITSTEQELFR